MKKIIFFLFTSIAFWACSGPKEVVQEKEVIQKQIKVLCLANDCADNDPLSLFEFNGIGFTKIKELEQVGKDSFELQVPEGQPHFLYIGTEAQAKLPVIFSDENMVIQGTCKAFRQSNISNSEYNTMYNEILAEIRTNKRAMQLKMGEFRQAAKEPEMQMSIKKALTTFDQQQLAYLDTIRKQNPFLGNIVALGTLASFPDKAVQYNNNEVDYFAAEYFKNADLKNPAFNHIPYLFESFKEYSQTLASVGLPQNIVNDLINQNLELVPDSTQAMRYALGGTLLGLQGKNHPSFMDYAKQFVQKFESTTDVASIDRLKTQMEQAKSFIPGGNAPEIEMKTREGEMMKLSDLRGKVVLIDFWASWCGPCRKENPNVVRVYNKYKSSGFEILGVSLDRTKDKWEAAIEKDGLTWHHVSDLKGWQNEAAQTYGVRSIPHTVLVDQKGKIIARNLRGSTLELKLAEIFDEGIPD
jgi:peroxiredoxin